MADKGFTINDFLDKMGAKLNIPPFIRSDKHLSAG